MSAAQPILDRSRIEIRLGDYGTTRETALSDLGLHPRVQEYRRASGSRMVPLDRDDILRKLPGVDYHVSKKVDGEFTALVWRAGELFTINPGGTVRVGMPWMAEAAARLEQAEVVEAVVAGELWVQRPDGKRSRVHDTNAVVRQPDAREDLETLRFSAFDLISLDDADPPSAFPDRWAAIERIFGGGERIAPVEHRIARNAGEVEKLFREWVEEGGAEGVVCRSDTAGTFKIKPRHTLDVAVIGFTESGDDREGMLHDLLVAVMRADRSLHILGRVGGGFSDDERRQMLSDLKDLAVDSEYAEVNKDHVAYQMVAPEWVIEISCLDLVAQTTRGSPVNRMVLAWDADDRTYRVVRRLPLAAVISPQFVRRRDDKQVQPFDIRIQQIAAIVEVPLADREASQMTLPRSELLRREVFTKELKGQTMVRKFLLWKTNKETEGEEYPAYVAHLTDWSPNRKVPLQRDVRISSSREQIEELYEGLKQANVKMGWSPVAQAGADGK